LLLLQLAALIAESNELKVTIVIVIAGSSGIKIKGVKTLIQLLSVY
jgi:hypothetical protein